MWFNEKFLAPYCLKHYSFADRIRIIDDEESTDDVKGIVAQYPNASLETIKFPAGFDNDIAVAKLNQCYLESKADWFIAVDADEFVLQDDVKKFLQHRLEDIFYVRLYQVYRISTDRDLDINAPIKEQRRYGDADAVKGNNKAGAKPIVVRTGLRKLKWMPGQHNIWNRHRYITSEEVLLGAHWMMADPCFCIDRRMRGVARQSEQNRIRGNSYHYNTLTREQVEMDLQQHVNDGRLF
jgi:hypothetical protein